MTFKTNIPERWLDNPEKLPVASLIDSRTSGTSDGPHLPLNHNSTSDARQLRNSFQPKSNFKSFGASRDSHQVSQGNRSSVKQEAHQLEQVLHQYEGYKDYEHEGDKANRLVEMMGNATNFAVAVNKHKQHLKSISVVSCPPNKKAQPPKPLKNKSMKSQDTRSQKSSIQNFEGLLEGQNPLFSTRDPITAVSLPSEHDHAVKADF